MSSYLICWKPLSENARQGWPEESLSSLATNVARNGTAVEPWRFQRKVGLKVGERVFLLRQGKRGHAILGYGSIADTIGDATGTVQVRFEALTSPSTSEVLATSSELQAIKAGRLPWSSQASGIRLSPDVAETLEKLVVDREPIPDAGKGAPNSNPDWTRDELILALDLYIRVPAARGSKSHPECIRLSEILNKLPIHHNVPTNSTFRNANSVGMKLSNFLKYDQTYSGQGLSGGSHLEKEVWDAFASNHEALHDAATAIISGASELEACNELAPDLNDDEVEAEEGRILTALHKKRERQPAIVKKKKARVLMETGKLICEVCTFDFSLKYGELGNGFAECHHSRPVSRMIQGEKTRLSDLHIVCSNCHRMIHKARPWLSIAELRAIVDEKKSRG